MDELTLVRPCLQLKEKAMEFKQEFFDHGEPVVSGSALLDQMEYEAWLDHIRKNEDPRTVQDDWVVASTFFAMRKQDEKLIGMIDIRHSLQQEFLKCYGGHIGYAVRPSERRKGYATMMLSHGLDFARSIGLKRVMLGCYSDNVPSKRTIEACGGVCVQTKPYTDGKPMNIYRITL